MRRRTKVVLALSMGAALGMAAGATAGPIGNAAVPQPTKPVDLSRYLGLWYEIGRYENSFEREQEGVTAEYRALPDGTLQVINSGRRGGLNGPLKQVKGRAKVVPGSEGAKLKVSFFGPLFLGDYWVLDHDPDYSWSIVGEPSGRFLWLLSRTRAPGQIRELLKVRAHGLGYDTNMIRWTTQ